MIVPSIDLMDGRAVQLVGGKDKALDAGDPRPLAERFGRVGEIAVVDLDAALGRGDNRAVIEDLLRRARCRVGGGIRTVDAARRWLDTGAVRVVLGTAATPEVLAQLPRERVIAALDARDGEVVVEGWQRATGARVEERMAALRELVGGFLVTFVEREGRMQGIDLDRVRALRDAAGGVLLTAAGGVTTTDDVARLDRLGVEAQIGMALYTGRLPLAEAFAAPLRSDRSDGLWPTVVCDQRGVALGLAWSDHQSLAEALASGRGVYHSRTRGLWIKGATSGAHQDLLEVAADCDRDALRFVVRQHGAGFCHRATRTCWGEDAGLGALARRLLARRDAAPPGSYTARLLGDPALLAAKLREEAGELAAAATASDVVHEAADVLYFAAVALARAGVDLGDVEAELDRRALRVQRRAGDAKEP
jgi:phosphoribosyl-ATP pyrophosphohydrolase